MLLIPIISREISGCGFGRKADSAVSLHSILKRRLCV